jgi:hypothetical protein
MIKYRDDDEIIIIDGEEYLLVHEDNEEPEAI